MSQSINVSKKLVYGLITINLIIITFIFLNGLILSNKDVDYTYDKENWTQLSENSESIYAVNYKKIQR